ncbi:hypothetical protein F2Q69_00005369 [Brassica cretica]|uniref:Uncharacterized protein n=1 Tax=Brassica cretica TaxID=69181 RepID=A0A8S9P265_BRACR|nr:hypothetical protein F2Q69_00005369 [Brassica cretica]
MKLMYHNNYQQKPFYNNQQGGYQSTQGQTGSSTSAPQESSTNTMLKQILDSQNNTAKNIGDELKILHTKIDGNYNDLNDKPMYGIEVVAMAEAQIVEKVGQRVEAKIVTRAELKAEKPIIENVVKKLKEVKLEETHEVEQSPYDKLPFPQRLKRR